MWFLLYNKCHSLIDSKIDQKVFLFLYVYPIAASPLQEVSLFLCVCIWP